LGGMSGMVLGVNAVVVFGKMVFQVKALLT
jgi:hypothetical protein